MEYVIEKRMQNALKALSDNPELIVAAAAHQFHVPTRRLRQSARRTKSRMQREGPGPS